MISGRFRLGATISALVVGLVTAYGVGAPIFVDASRPTSGATGADWEHAYPDLQTAITQAFGNPTTYPEIRVAQGRYRPSGTNDRNKSFRLINGVAISGGYAGYDSTNPNDRNVHIFESILTGDLSNNDYPGDLVTNRSDNSYCVVFGAQPTGSVVINSTAKLDGFTISGGTGGATVGPFAGIGAGIFLPAASSSGVVSSSPMILNCRIVDNVASDLNQNGSGDLGGGLFCSSRCQPIITNCVFQHNQAVAGAAIYLSLGNSSQSTRPQLANCSFIQNTAGSGAGVYLGGSYCEPVLNACLFERNTSGSGAAINVGAVSFTTTPQFLNCQFQSNIALTGGGGAVSNSSNSSFSFISCLFLENEARGGPGGAILNALDNNLTCVNCVFSRNASYGNGGAVANTFTGGGAAPNNFLTLTNCTFSANRAAPTATGGGVSGTSKTSMTIRNCLFKDNSDNSGMVSSSQISNAGSSTVTYSSIEGWSTSGTGNTNTAPPYDPLFVDAASNNLRLRSTSFSRDSGDGTSPPAANDPDDHPRVANGTVDRGAYEFPLSVGGQPLDCNANGRPDNDDIACLILTSCGAIAGSPDCNNNGVPDDCELSGNDCNGNEIPDSCDIDSQTSRDCNFDGVPDECPTDGFTDCNGNCMNDANDITNTTSADCNGNGVPDECDTVGFKIWTTNGDFGGGTLINVNHGTSEQLQRNTRATTAPMRNLWVATNKDTDPSRVHRIITVPSQEETVGVYRATPKYNIVGSYPEPQSERIAVDLDGNAWVANSATLGSYSGSTALKIGVVNGGTRVNSAGVSNADGEYLKPPFTYCTCEDRDGDGLIRTSLGFDSSSAANLLPWVDWDKEDMTDGGVKNAEDECILRFVRTTSTLTDARAIAIDRNNNVWVGGDDGSTRKFQSIDGFSGALGAPFTLTPSGSGTNYGGFGTIFNCDNLWSATIDNKPARYDPASPPATIPGSSVIAKCYGLIPDTSGNIWVTDGIGNAVTTVEKFAADSNSVGSYSTPSNEVHGFMGIACRPGAGGADTIWIADDKTSEIFSINANLTSPTWTNIASAGNSVTPFSVSTDADGRVWVASNTASTSSDIIIGWDPANPGSSPRMSLGSSHHFPITVGDMTGMGTLIGTGIGTWSVVHDCKHFGAEWCRARWNTESCVANVEPPGTHLEVAVRASDYELRLPMLPFVDASNDQSFLEPVKGRYVQIRVRFFGVCPEVGADTTPTLCDLAIIPTNPCIKGDVNNDGDVDGRDIQPFITKLLTGNTCSVTNCQADMDNSNVVDVSDISCFVSVLLGFPNCSNTCPGGALRTVDCNGNSVNDAEDIADGTSLDCNHNFIPDECDLDANDPDGNESVSADVNSNSVPDECEPDCNVNSIPDAWDITQMTSADVNTNGVPDECEPDCNNNNYPDDYDIAMSTSADCNINGIPDECETDCNENGVPDDCDIDPADPDGNQQVSADCNADGMPDECNLTLPPPYGSFDCNENGILDECDIASAFSEDANENGVPDECEESGLFGGESMMGGPEQAPVDEEAAWEAFYEWSFAQCWGPQCALSTSEQFQLYLDKLAELGLSMEGSAPTQ